LAYRTT